MRVNLSGVEAGFEPVPRGRYHLKVTDGELRESGPNAKHPGSEFINFEFTIQTGDHEGRRVWQNFMISHGDCDCNDEETFNKSLSNTKGLLKATGRWSDEELNSDEFEFEIDDLIGADVIGVVTVRKSEEFGDSNNVRRVLAMSEEDLEAAASVLP